MQHVTAERKMEDPWKMMIGARNMRLAGYGVRDAEES